MTPTSTAETTSPECSPITPPPLRALRLGASILPAALYLLAVFGVLMAALPATRGHLVYALDDTYIHMAIAKNLAAHGIFGVTSHEFASASSSILWPLLLAVLFKIFGPAAVIPLIAQIAISMALLWLSWEMLNRAGITSSRYACAVLAFLVFALPMVAMTFVAMEHLLHVLATLLFATVSVNYLNGPRTRFVPVLLCAALVTSVRYEGLFLVAAAALLFLLQKKVIHAVAIVASGAAPVVLFGLYSIAHGGFFLPNSLILKGQPIDIDTLLRLRDIAIACPEIFVLVIAALFLLAFGVKADPKSRGLLQLFLLTALLHHLLATYGWFYRYEAYLVALGLMAVAVAAWKSLASFPSRRAWTVTALLVLATPLIMRGYNSITRTPGAMADIYRQQFQMAEFFRTYYPQGSIAVNDIGAITYYGDPRCTDIVGLGSTQIVRARLSTGPIGNLGYDLRHNDPVLSVLQNSNIEVAAVYDDWFGIQRSAPPGWIKVGMWAVPETTVLGGHTVSFYGIGNENAERLRNNLVAFDNQLPQVVLRRTIP